MIHVTTYHKLSNELAGLNLTVDRAKSIALFLLQSVEKDGCVDLGNLDEEIVRIIREHGQGGKIPAIKVYRAKTGANLRECKDYVENIMWKLEYGKLDKKTVRNEAKRPKAFKKKVRLRHRDSPKAKKRKTV